MDHAILTSLAIIIILGAMAQWIAWALRLPSILLLLLSGFLAGPVFGWIDPDRVFGNLMLPVVSLSVAVILFEGGLTLRIREIQGARAVVLSLVTVGVAVTWIASGVAAHWILGFELRLALLVGAILSVTGPTVVLPLLRHIRPSGLAGSVLKWEGIVVDPIGAILAVVVFELAFGPQGIAAGHHLAMAFAKMLAAVVVGLAAAGLLVLAFRRYWVPDHLQNAVTMLLVVVSFLGCNRIQHESGLLAVSVMGIALGNQRRVDVHHILEFKENLRVFLLSAIFILLSARIPLADLRSIGLREAAFVVVLIILVRPASVAVSTLLSPLNRRERAFIACMAPRGIVAAAVASVFAISLEQQGVSNARLLVPMVFGTIVGTVLVYSVTSPMVARRLKLADARPQGLLLLGAGPFGREVGRVLQTLGIRILAAETNLAEVRATQMLGLSVIHGNVLDDDPEDILDCSGIGRMLALTPNEEVNQIAAERFSRLFGSQAVFRLPAKVASKSTGTNVESRAGRLLFAPNATHARLDELVTGNAKIKATRLTREFDFRAYRERHGDRFMPLFVLDGAGNLNIVLAGVGCAPSPGDTLVTLTWSDESVAG